MPIAITPRRKKDAPEVKRGEKAKPINKMPVKKAGGGKLKSVPEGKKGLSKLPAPVRNKMGFMKKGGKVGNVGKAMDKLTSKAIQRSGGSISEDKLISIMNKAGKSSGLFKKAAGGLVSPPKKRGDIGKKVFLSKVAKQMKKSGQPFGGKKKKGKK